MSEWISAKLDQVVQLKRGFDLPEPQRRPGIYPVLGSSGITGWHDEAPVRGPGVTIGRSGASIGTATFYNGDFWPLNTTLFVQDFYDNDPHYVFYLLHSLDFHGFNSGSAQPSLNRNFIAGIAVNLPPPCEQKAIAEVLGALDDKIAVNDRIASTSDELVRAAYERSIRDSAASVEVGTLGTLVRETVQADQLSGRENYIALENMPRRNMWLASWGNSSEVTSMKSRFMAGDVLFGKLRPYFHKVGLAFVDGVTSTDVLVIRPADVSTRGWLLAVLSSDEVVAHASAIGDGTRMPRAKWNDIAKYEIPEISTSHANRLNELVDALARRTKVAVFESRDLVELRDMLLPKLMSGEIRVREAEKAVEDAV